MKHISHGMMAAMLIAVAPAMAHSPAAQTSEDSRQLDAAWDEFQQAASDSAAFVRQHPFFKDAENRASAYAYLSSMLLARIEEDIVFDGDFPYFRVLDHRIREGGDNPDQRYLMASLNGGETYRVWGKLGKNRRLDFQIYAGDPFVAGSGGRSASAISFEQLKVEPDGTFELWLSPDKRPGNWMDNPKDANQLWVRQIFSDWSNETPGDVHIDRVGHEGDLKPVLSDAAMARRLRKAAADLRTHVRVWPTMVGARYLNRPPNTISQPTDPSALGGVPGRFMVAGNFDLAPDEALIVRTWPASGNYQGIQLADLWFSSLEYGNRQTSLTGDQAIKSKDGSYYFVIAGRDPGVANWLDTTGRRRGAILLRFDGMKETTFDPARYPTATKVKLADLRQHLPADIPAVGPEQRSAEIAARRRHVQLRFGN
ncbi:Protein of unknown function [Sphingomonas laterariae]|uniref:Uncharacterized protein n=1 Tax=Edaphosphingomonas laterariae TaxID=861865 RepID=A0A239KKT6_9SPHN|nr:DUF1214 domain-containing protein [Sphingomonas laterariae]SNT17794.1 Protein of unknown function [Sphingomonas laterariae]